MADVDPFELDLTNDPEIERLGANAAVQYALQFWNQIATAARRDGLLLDSLWQLDEDSNDDDDEQNHSSNPSSLKQPVSAHHTKLIRFTNSPQQDHRLYQRFRSNFGNYFPVDKLNVSGHLNPLTGVKWASLLVACDGVIMDFNFMTLLRADCLEPFWMTELQPGSDGLLIVPRAQFIFIELARCREGCYGKNFRNILQLFDIKTLADQLEEFLTELSNSFPNNSDACKIGKEPQLYFQQANAALELLQTQWPYPSLRNLQQSGIVRVLKRILKQSEFPNLELVESDWKNIQNACRDQLQRWQDIMELGKLSSMTSFTKRQQQAIRNAATTLALKQTSSLQSTASHTSDAKVKYVTKTTSNLSDIVVENVLSSEKKRRTAAKIFSDYGVVALPDFCCTEDEIEICTKHATHSLEAMQRDLLQPLGVVFDSTEAAFDFPQVRQRPGHRVDNRYMILESTGKTTSEQSPIAEIGDWLRIRLPSILFPSEEGLNLQLLYAGVVHAFPRKTEEDSYPPPQFWHRDGPSLFNVKGHHHPTHCFNVFVPLVDVDVINGTTEFVPGTHEDQRYEDVAADILLAASQQCDEDDLSQQQKIPDAGTVAVRMKAGSIVAFDIRVMHRGLSNHSDRERPVMYFTFARDWFQEIHMFQTEHKNETLKASVNVVDNSLKDLCHMLYKTATGELPNQDEKDYGHPHYTTRFDLLLIEGLAKDDAGNMTNVTASLRFCNANNKDDICHEFVDVLNSEQALLRKNQILKAARETRQQNRIKAWKDDFTSMEVDMSDVAILYQLTADILFRNTILLSQCGFSIDQSGIFVALALLKAYASSAKDAISCSKITSAQLENCFSTWWHGAESRSRFELITAVDNLGVLITPPSPEHCYHKRILVVFSSLGSGLARPEWKGTLEAVGAYGNPDLDVLHVMDFSYSWYSQDPDCEWKGGEYYENELKRWTGTYSKIFFLGDSMGASAALRFSQLAHTVLAFTPQVDISSYEAITRTDFTMVRRKTFKDELIAVIENNNSSNIIVHYGEHCDEDVRHIQFLPNKENLKIIAHDYNDHILSIHLRKQGTLTDVVSEALAPCICGNVDNSS